MSRERIAEVRTMIADYTQFLSNAINMNGKFGPLPIRNQYHHLSVLASKYDEFYSNLLDKWLILTDEYLELTGGVNPNTVYKYNFIRYLEDKGFCQPAEIIKLDLDI